MTVYTFTQAVVLSIFSVMHACFADIIGMSTTGKMLKVYNEYTKSSFAMGDDDDDDDDTDDALRNELLCVIPAAL